MTAKDSTDGVLENIAAVSANAALNIANFVLHWCGLTHAGTDLQRFGNLGDKAGPLYASSSGPVTNGRPANAGVATTQSRRLPKKDTNQINKESRQTDPRTINRANVAKWTVS